MTTVDKTIIIIVVISIIINLILKIWTKQRLKRIDGMGRATLIKGDQTQKTIIRKQ